MATGNQNQMEVLKNLRKKLALAVRSIQWSYAIFWSVSPRQPGVLEWGDGYYNGDIKTRKTVQAAELNPDQLGLQRSDQLRELYESLSLGETNPQAKRPTAALSPEDLTDAEWLPGRTLAKNQTIWLCNAHLTDTKVFSRSLLAKASRNVISSASIQTIVCFPHLGAFGLSGNGHHFSNDCSNEFADNLLREESNLVEGIDGEASQIQSWPFMDDAISNCLNNSANSSDCISQTHGDPETIVPLSDNKKETNSCMQETQECNNSGLQGNDIHYQSVLSNLLKSSHQLILGPYFRNGSRRSSFVSWRKDGLVGAQLGQSGNRQKLLKKVLFEVARMHENCRLESVKQNADPKPEVDKVSILDHTIEYLRDLERKVEELESYKEAMELESTTRNKPQDAIERTSDNYGPNKIGNTKKPSTNKRKACETEKTGAGNNRVRLRDSSADNVAVSVSDKDVSIEMKCSWKEGIMLGYGSLQGIESCISKCDQTSTSESYQEVLKILCSEYVDV
ncbi:hypothetical protein DH2020_005559 [Rehmannia glutinosa]|uniref:Transcription factor MYC/MYB N-terminal domain-containing protein n=1 Tax=Rehmannia glutinosa TaxID=99300 RepID=A0ABR0XGC4_REHGL